MKTIKKMSKLLIVGMMVLFAAAMTLGSCSTDFWDGFNEGFNSTYNPSASNNDKPRIEIKKGRLQFFDKTEY